MTSKIASSSPKKPFVLKLAKLVCYLFRNYIRPILRSNVCYHRRLECYKKILCITKVIGSRGGGKEILTMKGVQKRQFSAKSGSWTNVHACCSSKLIINNKCLVYKHSLDFPLNIHITKIVQVHISLRSATGPISPFVVLALCYRTWKVFLKLFYTTCSFNHFFLTIFFFPFFCT